jgi:hypothetical protein
MGVASAPLVPAGTHGGSLSQRTSGPRPLDACQQRKRERPGTVEPLRGMSALPPVADVRGARLKVC